MWIGVFAAVFVMLVCVVDFSVFSMSDIESKLFYSDGTEDGVSEATSEEVSKEETVKSTKAAEVDPVLDEPDFIEDVDTDALAEEMLKDVYEESGKQVIL